MSHFQFCLDRRFWRSKKVVQVVQIRGSKEPTSYILSHGHSLQSKKHSKDAKSQRKAKEKKRNVLQRKYQK